MLKTILADLHNDDDRLAALLIAGGALDINATDERRISVLEDARKELESLGVTPPAEVEPEAPAPLIEPEKVDVAKPEPLVPPIAPVAKPFDPTK